MSRGRRGQGEAVEVEVQAWLVAQGWRAVDQNFNAPGGELDLVMQRGEVLAFIEVRWRANAHHGWPEETVTAAKQRRVVLAARHWLARHGDQDCDPRFDVVAVVGPADARQFMHLEAAFEAGL